MVILYVDIVVFIAYETLLKQCSFDFYQQCQTQLNWIYIYIESFFHCAKLKSFVRAFRNSIHYWYSFLSYIIRNIFSIIFQYPVEKIHIFVIFRNKILKRIIKQLHFFFSEMNKLFAFSIKSFFFLQKLFLLISRIISYFQTRVFQEIQVYISKNGHLQYFKECVLQSDLCGIAHP